MEDSLAYKSFRPFSTSQARGLVALAAVMMLLSTLAVIARFASRRIKGIKLVIDEWLLLIALIFYYASAAQVILDVGIGGIGHHAQDVPPSYLLNGAKLAFSDQLFYPLTMAPIRWSLLSLFIRIFIFPTFRRIAYAVGVFNAFWFIYNILGVTLRCHPISLNWDLMSTGHCADLVTIALIAAIWSLVLSLMVWSLPVPMVWRLQTSVKNKVGFTALFGLGIFDIAVGIVRVVTTLRVDEADITWSTVPSLSWILVEPAVAIVVACLPVCRPLFDRILPDAVFERISSAVASYVKLLKTSRREGHAASSEAHGPHTKQVQLDKFEKVGRKGISSATIEASPYRQGSDSAESMERGSRVEDGIQVRCDVYVAQSDRSDFH